MNILLRCGFQIQDIKSDERKTAVDVHSAINLQQVELQLNAIEQQINQKSVLSQSDVIALTVCCVYDDVLFCVC